MSQHADKASVDILAMVNAEKKRLWNEGPICCHRTVKFLRNDIRATIASPPELPAPAEWDALLEAVKPFVDFIGDKARALPLDMPLTQGSSMARKQLTVRDFRMLAAAYSAILPEKGG
jgi:hypothetical protein